ncbi:MAG: LysM peptidoglycan-binding domain-containing protein [Opitutaceae bacterium]|nr:LysM peptidoglycan-binding domain-containing protein [Opitutaceae bacterium]
MTFRLMRSGGMVWVLGMGLVAAGWAQQPGGMNPMQVELANLREDVRLLSQRVGELSLTVEHLTRQNSDLQSRASQSYVTIEQLNQAIAELNRTMSQAQAEQKREILRQVGTQMERLAKQTQAALDALAKGQAARPTVAAGGFSENYPKEGISYTVQSGDTISVIARKTNSRVQDIINANKIADPTRLRVGQTLFIPQGK